MMAIVKCARISQYIVTNPTIFLRSGIGVTVLNRLYYKYSRTKRVTGDTTLHVTTPLVFAIRTSSTVW